ncbi:hypothetical protein FJ976_17365 [Mesorhizobium sp. B1-1-9]|uniref:hypothetical protein n=1 Tax=Mesorhizobium sp. B1-1-9 TaxID=2589975 RepID=UPI00112CCCDD|nr:hypothetical protein [Mesorhizobium sp. B1-1-9]TPN49498.1 hypothetical protein FJ976_17365 [Mesorhizobium sp. B1-1-9]
MTGEQDFSVEGWRQAAHIRDREITPNERFWLEVIRLASWDSDPAPTLERVQKLRMIFQTRI